jgi:hypothetical protein
MTRAARLYVFVPVAAGLGVSLNLAAMMIVATTSGLSGVPSPLLEIVYLACWPSALIGVPHEYYFYTHYLRNMLVNILGWATVGIVPSLLPSRPTRK